MGPALRYQVIATLGRGGFGTVYRARYVGEGDFRKDVALKVLNPNQEGTDEMAARLRDEARVLGLLRHRAIVQVDRLVRLDGRWAVVMEFVDGVDLSRLLSGGQRPPVGVALEIVTEVAGALHTAYNASGPDGAPLRLLHRDVKPSNLQLTAMGEVKVLDFGISRADFDTREASTREMAFGTPEYMSPERLDNENGPASDVYGLGLVLFELLTGEPYGRSSASERKHAVLLSQRMGVLESSLQPAPAGLVSLVRDTLAYEADARPTARELERRCIELRQTLHHEPLRFWAERAVPPLLLARDASCVQDEKVGTILVASEGDTLALPSLSRPTLTTGSAGGSPSSVKRGKAAPPSTAKLVSVALVGFAGVVVLGLGGLLLWLLSRSYQGDAPVTPPVVASAPATPVSTAKPVVSVSPVKPAAAPAGAPAAAPKSSATPPKVAAASSSITKSTTVKSKSTNAAPAVHAAPAPVVEVTPAAAPTATVSVRLSGDAETVTLVRDGRTTALPATVAPGTYELRASFIGRETMSLGSVTIPDVASVRLSCSEALLTCSRL